jgi:hypothetical protein
VERSKTHQNAVEKIMTLSFRTIGLQATQLGSLEFRIYAAGFRVVTRAWFHVKSKSTHRPGRLKTEFQTALYPGALGPMTGISNFYQGKIDEKGPISHRNTPEHGGIFWSADR